RSRKTSPVTKQPSKRSGSPLSAKVKFRERYAPIYSNDRFCALQSAKSRYEAEFIVVPFRECVISKVTNFSGSEKGSGLRSTAFTTLKIAVFAPMPRVRAITATRVKPGVFRNVLKP